MQCAYGVFALLIDLDYRNEAVLGEIERLWRDLSPTWQWWPRNPYQAEYSWAVDRLTEACGGLEGRRIMDAGGGRGALQHVLAGMGAAVLNVDVDARPQGSALAAPCDQLRADLEATGLDQGSFDGIISVSSIEHNPWEKILAVVRHLLGLLKPGAPLVLTVPAGEVRQWIPAGGWPEPHQAGWPCCYLFDAEAMAELVLAVRDLAEPVSSLGNPSEQYRTAWRVGFADMQVNSPPQSRYPYLSAGLVLRRLAPDPAPPSKIRRRRPR